MSWRLGTQLPPEPPDPRADTELSWFVDSLDAKGGIAFAAFRPADLARGEPDASIPAVRVAAPGFRPQAVSSRAVGLAASRGVFQLGVAVDGRELGFAALDDLVDFVRRVYVARGGGADPGPPEEAPGPTRPFGSPGDGGDAESVDDELGNGPRGDPAQRLEKGLMEFGGLFTHASESVDLIEPATRSTDDAWSSARATVIPNEEEAAGYWRVTSARVSRDWADEMADPLDLFTRAIQVTARELLTRGPADDGPSGLAAWSHALRRLGDAAARLGAWDRVLGNDGSSQLLQDAGADVPYRLRMRLGHGPSGHARYLAAELLSGVPIEEWGRYPGDFGTRHLSTADDSRSSNPRQRIQDLRSWPVPPTSSFATGPNAGETTILDLLTRALSSPGTLYRAGWDDTRLLLFAVAHLQPRSLANPPRTPIDLALVTRVAMLDACRAWLIRQMPARAFPPAVEDMIDPASTGNARAAYA